MNEEEVNRALATYEQALKDRELNAKSSNINMAQQEVAMEHQEQGLVKEQLDVGEILDNVHNLLQGYTLRKNANGYLEWVEPVNNDMKVLTDYGINYILGAVQWYLNKNTLLSNYDEATINQKMLDFSITIIDDVFMEYDKMFFYPTLEDCQEELEQRIKRSIEVKKFSRRLLGLKTDEKELRLEILKEMEGRIERELSTIKEQKIKNKLKRFESIMRFIQDTVHSSYLRAWKGQERSTLRQHTHITETKGGIPLQSQQQRSLNPLSMFSRH